MLSSPQRVLSTLSCVRVVAPVPPCAGHALACLYVQVAFMRAFKSDRRFVQIVTRIAGGPCDGDLMSPTQCAFHQTLQRCRNGFDRSTAAAPTVGSHGMAAGEETLTVSQSFQYCQCSAPVAFAGEAAHRTGSPRGCASSPMRLHQHCQGGFIGCLTGFTLDYS